MSDSKLERTIEYTQCQFCNKDIEPERAQECLKLNIPYSHKDCWKEKEPEFKEAYLAMLEALKGGGGPF